MYEVQDFSQLKGLHGFSDQLLENHFKLYEGYVNNTNKVLDLLKNEEMGSYKYAELKRRFGWEYNGMRLHEHYFSELSLQETQPDEKTTNIVEQSFGSFENWQNDFKATGAMRGIGWVILYQDEQSKQLFNCWVNEHDTAHLAGAKPILVMDVFEHAFITDYGLKKADYIESYFKAIDWQKVSENLIN